MCSGYFKKRNNRYFLKKAKNGLLGFFTSRKRVLACTKRPRANESRTQHVGATSPNIVGIMLAVVGSNDHNTLGNVAFTVIPRGVWA